jgi:hypothetical protein
MAKLYTTAVRRCSLQVTEKLMKIKIEKLDSLSAIQKMARGQLYPEVCVHCPIPESIAVQHSCSDCGYRHYRLAWMDRQAIVEKLARSI